MREDDHDDVVHDASKSNAGRATHKPAAGPNGAAGRRFEDIDGAGWVVSWRPVDAHRTQGPGGIYVFRSLAEGAEHTLPTAFASGWMLKQMPLADLRQLLAIARSGLVGEE